jgi:glucokinase
MSSEIALGIDLGATNIKAVWMDPDGNMLRRKTTGTGDSVQAAAWKEAIRALAAEDDPATVGIAAPGLAHVDERRIAFMPGRLSGLEGLDWTDFLGRSVNVLNDAHAALLGEAWCGAARGCRYVVMLTLGTGVGGAVLVDGRLLLGSIGRAGHLGHMSLDVRGKPDIVGTPGSLEDAVGDCTVRQRTGFASTEELVQAAQLGSAEAQRGWNNTVRALAAGIASVINAFDPELVVIGGGIATAAEALFRPLKEFLDQMEWRPAGHQVPVVPASLAEWGGAIGAARYALYGKESRISQ